MLFAPLLLAQSNEMPLPKKISILVLFGAVGVTSIVGLFAPRPRLEKMAGIIGTRNPIVARIVCALGVIVSWLSPLLARRLSRTGTGERIVNWKQRLSTMETSA